MIKSKEGKEKKLSQLLTKDDLWELKKNKTRIVVAKHDAVKKIADYAGISTDVQYTILIEPSITNNYTVAIQCRITDGKKHTVELGEVNRGNLGTRGRQNPINMCQKRAFDRAVFRHLGILGILGEDELPDEEETKNDMDNLTIEESKAIVPLINEIANVKDMDGVKAFNAKMKKEAVKYNANQLKVLRSLRDKTENKFKKQSF